jgi:hemolysin activation/secretion protein
LTEARGRDVARRDGKECYNQRFLFGAPSVAYVSDRFVMGPDLPPLPPEAAPQVAMVAPAKQDAEPIVVESHGYRYVVSGNTLLAPEVIVSSLEAGETPKDAVESLNRAYQKAGYLLTALRGQVDGQMVAIQVIHGRLTEADLVPSLADFYAGIEERLDLDRNTLIRKSALAENYAARQGMRPKVNFVPAQEVGGSKIVVTEEPIEGAKPWNAGLGFNNLGSRFSSRYVAQANGAFRPGAGAELTATYTEGLPGLAKDSAGSLYHAGAVGASVVTPWGLYSASYSNTRYVIGESSRDLGSGIASRPDGDITIWGVSGMQLAFAGETARWTFTESFAHTDNFATVFDGAFVTQDQHYGVVAVGTTFSNAFAVLGENASFSAGLTVSKGVSSPSGSFLPVAPGTPDSRFTLIQGSLSYTQALSMGYSAGLTWTGQWAGATLPQNQQWVLGGFGNLTAWSPAVLVGDSGMLARASLYTPAWQWSGLSVTGGAFVEAGMVRPHYSRDGAAISRGLGDAGLSLSGSMKTGTSLTMAYAWPVWSRNLDQIALDGLNHAHLYFSLNQTF